MQKTSLRPELKARLETATRVVVLGVGSEYRGDDAVGIRVARALGAESRPTRVPLVAFETETAPENFTGAVRRLAPSHVILVDAADFKAEPGSIGIIDPSRIGGVTFCTHSLPVALVARYLASEAGCEVLVLGVQPQSLGFGNPMSEAVLESVAFIVDAIGEALASETDAG